jgi:DNA polymerase-3 subunit gamma/tau
MLSNSASNALLKTLEEPPPNVIFILATTELHKILPTIMSRCQRFDFRRLGLKDITLKLDQISKSEGIKVKPEALKLIARVASGSLRDAENLLEQLSTFYGLDINLAQVQALLGITDDERVKEIVKHIVSNNIPAGIEIINAVSRDGLDLKQFNRELVAYLRYLLLIKNGCEKDLDLTTEEISVLKDLAAQTSAEHIVKAVKLFATLDLDNNDYSTLPFELALVDYHLESTPSNSSNVNPILTKLNKHKEKITLSPVADNQKVDRGFAENKKPEESILVEEKEKISSAVDKDKLEFLKANWKQIIEQAPENTKRTAAIAILRSAGVQPIAFDGNTIVLTFKYSYHKEKIEEIENRKTTAEIISKFLGHSCQVRCVYEAEENHLVREAQKLGAKITKVEEK